jgi:N-acetyl-beta-hexosaminidase
MLEIDVPGHSRGLLPLAAYGAVFCDPADATCSQLYGDPANKTYGVLTALLGEMAPLFPEPVLHLGCDETGVVGTCTVESTFAVERLLIDYVQGTLGKTPAGWE